MKIALVILALVVPSALVAAELPAAFSGTWRITNPDDSRCRPVQGDSAPEGHMLVKPGRVAHYESSCRVVSVERARKTSDRDVIAAFQCEGEGMRWSVREVWHVETIDGKTFAAVTPLAPPRYRDAKGRNQKPAGFTATSIYSLCK